jgi:hypothetical protein
MFARKDILRMALSNDQESTNPGFYRGLPTSSSQVQPPKDNSGDHLGTPIKPIPQPVPTSNGSDGLPYVDYGYDTLK